MDVNELGGKKISVIGAARSGVAVARLLQSQGALVFVSDRESREKLQPTTAELESAGIELEIGSHSERVYDCSLMVISPGVPSNAPVVLEARRRGIRIVGELEAASWFCRAPIVAVTGSNGKTTTTSLIGRMLSDAKKDHVVAGNIGTAFSSLVLDLVETSVAVLEVSSFQLDHIETFHPRVGLILNITPDHLDRYGGSFEEYTKSKCRIFMNQGANDILIYNNDDEVTRKEVSKLKRTSLQLLPFSAEETLAAGAYIKRDKLVIALGDRKEELIDVQAIRIRGRHNLYNSMAAALAARAMEVSNEAIRQSLLSFEGVEHRLEFVRELNGVRYINDSKATNVNSVWYALQSFDEPIVLLLGGRDKGNDYSALYEMVKKKVRAIVALGESADKVVENFKGLTRGVKVGSMRDAVGQAERLAQRGDVVLLSPACSSFDWFENYEHRGRVFKEAVNQL